METKTPYQLVITIQAYVWPFKKEKTTKWMNCKPEEMYSLSSHHLIISSCCKFLINLLMKLGNLEGKGKLILEN